MLSINNISFHLGSRALYDGASLHVKPKDRIGLIGANGTGKSTLLRVIDGEYQVDGGDVTMAKDCTIGFLNQDLLSFQSTDSILQVAMEAFKREMTLQRQIDEVLHQMEVDYKDELVEKLSAYQEEFDMLGGYVMQAKAESILEGLGFTTADLKRPLKEFSGGWRMRVMLAKLLLAKPSLLMLDEPTNHLDMPSIQWIENYLSSYEGAIIIVSHDRRFLDATVTSIVEVSQGDLIQYAGNYTFYLEERELRQEIQRNAYDNQQQKIKQTEKFIERFRSKASKARQVQSKVKSLDRLDKVDDVVDEKAKISFKFTFKTQPGRFIMHLEDIHKAYGQNVILDHAKAIIERGDKIALIGANGKGKSTLLRVIADTEGFQGKRDMGHNVLMSFFAQHQLESLNVENEILEELKQAGSQKTEMELRSVLGCFLFKDEEVFKKIKVLSGGEKSRVALAKTLISESNFLLLDEPTNHLDMQSVNILTQALQQYEGTFVIVSHDRHFVSQVANKIWYIEDRQIKEYPGTFDEYLYWDQKRKEQQGSTFQRAEPEEPKKLEPAKADRRNENRRTPEDREMKQLNRDMEKQEAEVSELEDKVRSLEKHMADEKVFGNPDKLAKANAEYKALKKRLVKANQDWEAIAGQIEAIETSANV